MMRVPLLSAVGEGKVCLLEEMHWKISIPLVHFFFCFHPAIGMVFLYDGQGEEKSQQWLMTQLQLSSNYS